MLRPSTLIGLRGQIAPAPNHAAKQSALSTKLLRIKWNCQSELLVVTNRTKLSLNPSVAMPIKISKAARLVWDDVVVIRAIPFMQTQANFAH